jgi:segregation and condensation protein B
MSLKAKLEAVIYAAEEPVTLAQLAALFAADALEWKAEQQAAQAEQAAAEANAPEASTDPQLVLNDAFYASDPGVSAMPAGLAELPIPEPVADSAPDAGSGQSAESEPVPPAADAPPAESAGGDSPETAPDSEPDPAAEPDAADAEARRLARLRDREVKDVLRQLIGELIQSCASDNRGVEVREIAGGDRMATKPECHDAVRSFVKSLKPALRLSLPALETLAVIAYKQPVTAPEVNEIRGVDSSGVFGSLLARKLISTAGRKPVVGRPILYKTTREFLLRFGLKDVSELPSMEEFEKLAAIELDEEEPVAPEDTAPEIAADLSLELSETELEESADEADTDAESEAAPTTLENAP